MKTLYEILEVSETASKEIIEKAYKVLAKKYHPDLQIDGNKQDAEKKMKQINEAYEILSDESKRKEYDEKLAMERQKEKVIKQPETMYSYEQENKRPMSEREYKRPMSEKEYREELKKQYKEIREEQERQREQYEQRYQQAYYEYLKSLGYKIKYKWTWKRFRDLLITICIIVAICSILWFFPPTHKMIMDFYNSSSIIKSVIDLIFNVFKGIWNGICAVFKNK